MKYLIVRMAAILCAATLFSCQKGISSEEVKDNLGVVVKKQSIWRVTNTSSSDKADYTIGYSSLIDGNLMDDYADSPGTGRTTMILRDTETGARKWGWRDVLRDFEPVRIDRGSVNYFQNYLFYDYGPRHYCIDTRTGQTVWRKEAAYSAFGNSAMLGSTYFTKGTPWTLANQSIVEDRIYAGDVRTGEEREIVIPSYSRKSVRTAASWQRWIGLISDVRPIMDGADTLLLITYTETAPAINQFEAYIGLYNMSRQQWIYDRARLNPQWTESFNTTWLTVEGDKMFTILNNAVACSNWRTGELIWFRTLPSFAQIPTPIENKYLAIFSTDSRLFLLDIETGRIIWEKDREIKGGPNQMYYDQGILYYLTANLNAVEIPSGNRLWSIPSPTEGKISGHFTGFIVGSRGHSGQKGRIFTRTGYETYCFEAIK